MGWREANQNMFRKTTSQIAGNGTSQARNLYLNSHYFENYFLENIHFPIVVQKRSPYIDSSI